MTDDPYTAPLYRDLGFKLDTVTDEQAARHPSREDVTNPAIILRKLFDARGKEELDAVRIFYFASICAEAFQMIERLTGGTPALGKSADVAVPWQYITAMLAGQCAAFDDGTASRMHDFTVADSSYLEELMKKQALSAAVPAGRA
jgi:hypothetical protein